MRQYDFLPAGELEKYADGQIRHKRGAKGTDFLAHWLKVFRPTAYATRDNSWGELEKLVAVFFPQAVRATRIVRTIFQIDDMRDVTPEMVAFVKAQVDKNYEICQNCYRHKRDEPGLVMTSEGYRPCPVCNGLSFVEKGTGVA